MGPQSQLHHWRKRAQSLDCFQPDRAEYKEQPVAQRRNTHTPPKKKKNRRQNHFTHQGIKSFAAEKDEGIVVSWPWNPPAYGGKLNGKMRRHPQRDCVLVRIAACQLGLRVFILLGLVRYTVEFWAELTPVWPRLPAWLSDWATPLTCPRTRRLCVCLWMCVFAACLCMSDVLHPVLGAEFSPSLPSLSLLHIKPSIIHPTTLLTVSGRFLLCFSVVTFAQGSSTPQEVYTGFTNSIHTVHTTSLCSITV